MCGIAGVIHRDGPSDLGTEITRMLQSMKHRGPDSTGYALYGPADDLIVVSFMQAEPKEYAGIGVEERLHRNRAHLESRFAKIAPDLPADHIMLMNMCGRGDKDIFTVAEALETTI